MILNYGIEPYFRFDVLKVHRSRQLAKQRRTAAKQFGRIGPNSFRESAFSHCFALREACHARFHLSESVFLVESFFAR